MEVDQVLPGKRTHQGAYLVRVLEGERRVLHQLAHTLQTTRQGAARLHAEPLIHNQRVVLELLGETGQCRGFFRLERRVDQHCQRRQAFGHIVAVLELLQRRCQHLRLTAKHQVRQRNVLQGTTGKVLGFSHIRRGFGHFAVGLVTRPQGIKQAIGQLLAGKLAGGMDRLDIGHVADFREVGFARQRQHFRDHCLIQLVIAQHRAQRLDQTLIHDQRFTTLMLADQLLEHLHRQLLAGIPAVEAVGVVLHEEHQLVTAVVKAQLHRCRKTAQQGWQRFFVDANKGVGLLGLRDRQHATGAGCDRFTGQLQGDLAALGIQQAQLDRDHERQFFDLVRGWRAALRKSQAVGVLLRVVVLADGQARRACLAVPALELAQVGTVGVLHRLDKVVAGHRLAIMALEVQVAALAEAFGP